MNQSHYFLSSVKVFDEENLLQFLPRALISRSGVYKLFDETEAVKRAFLEGKVFRVHIDGNMMKGRLVRESGVEGVHYNLKLLHEDGDSEGAHLEQMRARGFGSPWKREFPRLSIEGLSGRSEHPVSVVLPRLTGKVAGEVINFSYHGMMFEILCSGPSLSEFVGQKLNLQMVTSRAHLLNDVQARVSRIYDEVLSPQKLIRGFGVQFLKMSEESRLRYNGMILDACNEIRNES